MAPEVQKEIDALKAKNKAEGKETTDDAISKLQRAAADRIPRPPLSELIDHIDHIAKVAGVDHVGLGSDFDGISGQLPQGIDSPADLPKITAALMARGYSPERLPEDSRGKPAARDARSGSGKQTVANGKPAADYRETTVRQAVIREQ